MLNKCEIFPSSQKKSYIQNKSIKKEFYHITATQSSSNATKELNTDVNTVSSNPQVKSQALEDCRWVYKLAVPWFYKKYIFLESTLWNRFTLRTGYKTLFHLNTSSVSQVLSEEHNGWNPW